MSRALAVLAALALAVLAGCGGSAAPPPAAAPAAGGQPAGAQPVADGGASSNGGISVDLDAQRRATKRALSEWGAAATKACRKSHRKLEGWGKRLSLKRNPSAREAARFGRLVTDVADEAEYEYDLLRAVPLPKDATALDAIFSFFDKEEEALTLVRRLGIELTAQDDLESIVFSLHRLERLIRAYKRSARSVHAAACAA